MVSADGYIYPAGNRVVDGCRYLRIQNIRYFVSTPVAVYSDAFTTGLRVMKFCAIWTNKIDGIKSVQFRHADKI